MSSLNGMRQSLEQQKEGLAALESQLAQLETRDYVFENAQLTGDLALLRDLLALQQNEAQELRGQNQTLREALYAKMYGMRADRIGELLKRSDDKVTGAANGEERLLRQWEQELETRVKALRTKMEAARLEQGHALHVQLDTLEKELARVVVQSRSDAAKSRKDYSTHRDEAVAMRDMPITAEEVAQAADAGNLERFIGLNLINKLGLLLIVIGVIVAAQYTYHSLPDAAKGGLMFLLGAAFLVVGELLNRKKANVFSLGLTAGGVAVLYAALSLSYFALGILGVYPALGLCLLVTAVAFVLALRYNAQVVLAFALVGGYLPMLSLVPEQPVMLGAGMVYFLILSALALGVSFYKRWTVSACMGLVLNILGTVWITMLSAWVLPAAVIIGYIFLAFLSYTLISVAWALRTGERLRAVEVVLLAVNTIFSSAWMYFAFRVLSLTSFYGLLALLFALAYLGLGLLIEKRLPVERNTCTLFFLTGLAFAVLVVPFQFGVRWLSLGWLVEGVALAVYGILTRQRMLRRVGYTISAFCLAAFIFVDVLQIEGIASIVIAQEGMVWLFGFKYLAMTLGSMGILVALLRAGELPVGGARVYGCAVTVNGWIYLCYLISDKLWLLCRNGSLFHLDYDYLLGVALVAISIIYAAILARIRQLEGFYTDSVSLVLYGVAVVGTLIINGSTLPQAGQPAPSTLAGLVASALLWLLTVGAVLALYDALRRLSREIGAVRAWQPLALSAFAVVSVTQNLVVQYSLSFASVFISILYVLTALGWILFGFARRSAIMRRFGLGLAVLSVAKLFLIDLQSITEGYRIISYFSLGLALLAISFIYQYFIKRLEPDIKAFVGAGAQAEPAASVETEVDGDA